MPNPTPVNLIPDMTNAGEVTIRHAGTSRTEPFDATDTLARVLDRREFLYDRSEQAVRLRESELAMSPRVMGVYVLPDGRCQTVCTVTVLHRRLFPDGLFEYQYATGRLVSGSLATGFAEWVDTDLDVLIEAVTGKVDRCTLLDVIVPATADRPLRLRRAFIGPIEQRGSSAAVNRHKQRQPRTEGAVFGPSLCLTDSPATFVGQIEGDGLFGLKFYGVRQSSGTVGADCRVNGNEFDPGKKALAKYVRTWPGREPRAEKQYVVIRDAEPLAQDPDL